MCDEQTLTRDLWPQTVAMAQPRDIWHSRGFAHLVAQHHRVRRRRHVP